MKKVLILMLGLVASTASFAKSSTPSAANVQSRLAVTADHKIKLYVQPFSTKGELAIRDANGQAFYNTTVSLGKGLSQQFDFSNLPVGTYQLVLTAGQQAITRTFVGQADPDASFVMQ